MLIGDILHTKASYLSARMHYIQVPSGLSIIEEQLSLVNISDDHW